MTQVIEIASLDSVRQAAQRIAPYAHRTPVLTCGTIDQFAGRSLFFKCENFQKVGAFKFRGACNAVLSLPEEDAQRGVVTHSSGNHAQAVALASRLRGIEAHIIMPRTAPMVKRRAVEGYGATVHPCDPTLFSRESHTQEVVEKTGAVFVPPYDDPDIISGQGTVTLELMEQVDDLDAIITPIGGGGLAAGTCVSGKGLNPSLRIFAGEPKGADDAARSLAAGKLIPQTAPDTIADGLLTSMGEKTWAIIRDNIEAVITVSDEEIIAAMRLVWERMKIIIEPSAAVPVAAVLTDQFKSLTGIERLGVVLSGGNVDLDRLPWPHATD